MTRTAIARRRDQILSLLATHGELSAETLSERLNVTVQTIRSDLRDMDDDGLVRRRHGAANLSTPAENSDYHPRQSVSQDEKARIGDALARIVPAGASIALGTGTTVEACARALVRHEGMTVFTNNIHAVLALRFAKGIAVSLAGGAVRMRDLDFIGSESVEFFARLRPDFAVFSVGGVSHSGDLLDFNMEEVRARRAIFDCATHRILVIDGSKIGRAAHHAHGKIWSAETVICSARLPAEAEQEMQFLGRRLIRC